MARHLVYCWNCHHKVELNSLEDKQTCKNCEAEVTADNSTPVGGDGVEMDELTAAKCLYGRDKYYKEGKSKMKVYVTVSAYCGLLDDVDATLDPGEAQKLLKSWNEKYEIKEGKDAENINQVQQYEFEISALVSLGVMNIKALIDGLDQLLDNDGKLLPDEQLIGDKFDAVDGLLAKLRKEGKA